MYSYYAAGSGNIPRRCTSAVNNVSVNLSPFRLIRYTYVADFSNGYNGVDCVGHFKVMNTSKNMIKTMNFVFRGGYLETTTTDVNVSDINEQVFFYAAFQSAKRAVSKYSDQIVTIKKIEFIV